MEVRAAQDSDSPQPVDGVAGVLAVSGLLRKTLAVKEIDDERGAGFGSHAASISEYAGPQTCLSCHGGENSVGPSLHDSVHYQWKGNSYPHITGSYSGEKLGKMGGINDFCTYPDINWLGKMTTLDGKTVDGGCAKCHIGMGEMPSETYDPGNVDCLVCHSPDYQRTLQADSGSSSGWTYVPNEAKMGVGILAAARNITLPGKQACLNCHSKSGGGNNFKRGDIEEFHRAPTRAFDVHMASVADGGLGFECTTCHTPVDHEISGRGVDLPGKEGVTMTCADAGCHGGRGDSPHVTVANASRLNTHAKRVNCTVCHIPAFAKMAATDMHRDYSQPADIVHSSLLYEPYLEMQNDVIPAYAFFNGANDFYRFGDVATPASDGYVYMTKPLGDVNSSGAKINAFKLHRGTMARNTANQELIGLKMGILFQTGNVNLAIQTGAQALGWDTSQGWDFVQTRRYMGIYHGVEPKENALACATCHDGNRLDFAALGYTPTRPASTTCASGCHSNKYEDYLEKGWQWLHSKHVDSEQINCSSCHGFSSPR